MSLYTTKKQKDISVSFMNDLTKMLDCIEEISNQIKEGEYLELMNILKDLHSYNDKFNKNTIVKEHRERSRRPVRAQSRTLTREEKLKSEFYTSCDRCDRIVLKKGLTKHKERGICRSILQKKTLSSIEGKTLFTKEQLINIETKDFEEILELHKEEIEEEEEKKE